MPEKYVIEPGVHEHKVTHGIGRIIAPNGLTVSQMKPVVELYVRYKEENEKRKKESAA